jgi:polysaccharide deacetylase family protein (PEP-CTERM system associated)
MANFNALTVDVEDYYHVLAFANVIPRKDWDQFPSRVAMNTYRVLEILARQGARATFFVLGWVARRYPNLVADIFKAGHRVGCHGYAHQPIYSGTQLEFRKDLREAKQTLEDALGSQIKSYRAPSYSIVSQTLWALEILGEEGFEYDSSIVPVIHDHYGLPGAPRFPYVKELACGRKLREFPPSTVRLWGLNIPVAGGGYFRLFPYSFTAWAIRRINQGEQQPAMVYLHPWEIDPDQPRISASWRSRFRHYQNLESTEEKFIKLLQDSSWAPMEEVWSSRLGSDAAHEV